MDLNELLTCEPAQIGHKLAAAAVVSARMGKQADLQSTIESIKHRVTDGLKSGNPLYTGAAGAAGLGGLSALRESMRPKKERRWGNVATAAGFGGLAGAAAPMVAEGAKTLMSNSVPSKPPVSQTPGITSMLGSGLSRLNSMLPEGWKTTNDSGVASAISHALPADAATLVGLGSTAALRGGAGGALMRGGNAELAKNNTLPIITGVQDSAVKDSLNSLQNAGFLDRYLAAKHGLPDIEAINAARPTQLAPGASPYQGANRWRAALTGRAPTTPNATHGPMPAGAPQPARVPVPTLGKNPAHARAAVQGIRAGAPRPGWGSWVPAAFGLGVDLYRNYGGQ